MTMVYEDRGDEAAGTVPMRRIRFTINGEKKIAEVEPRLLLSHLIRRGVGLNCQHRAGLDGMPVDQHRAGAAVCRVAAGVCTG